MALLHFTSGTTGHAEGRRARARGGRRAPRDRRGSRSTSTPTTSSGARPIRAGSPARRTASSRRSRTASTSIVDEADFDAERWYAILQDERVTVWYTAPTAMRMLMKAGSRAAAHATTSRACASSASVGEPLNPEAVRVGRRGARPADPRQLVADRDRRDHDRQLRRRMDDPAGLDGPAAARHRGRDRAPRRRRRRVGVGCASPDAEGELALRPGWPSMFRGYLHDEARYREVLRRRLVPHRRSRRGATPTATSGSSAAPTT